MSYKQVKVIYIHINGYTFLIETSFAIGTYIGICILKGM